MAQRGKSSHGVLLAVVPTMEAPPNRGKVRDVTLNSRKSEMTEAEHAACDEILALRKQMGLSQRQMARQIGCVPATLARWEDHGWAPRRFHLLRLQELFEMNAALDERSRKEFSKDFQPGHGPKGKLSWKFVRRMTPIIAALAIRALGKGIEVSAAQYAVEKLVQVQAKYDPERKVYRFWVKKPPRTSAKRNGVTTDACLQPN